MPSLRGLLGLDCCFYILPNRYESAPIDETHGERPVELRVLYGDLGVAGVATLFFRRALLIIYVFACSLSTAKVLAKL